MCKLFSLAAVVSLAACTAACSTLRSEVTCDRAEAVARIALEAIEARCPAVLGQLPPVGAIAPDADAQGEPPIPHPRT